MNRLLSVLAVCGALFLGAFITQAASAQGADSLSDAHTARIRENCVTAQKALDELRRSDARSRRYRGKLYEPVSAKLMAPLNSRIESNKLAGLEPLAAAKAQYDTQFNKFVADYIEYDKSLEKAITMKCAKSPEEFYKSVVAAREKRQHIHADTVQLNNLITAYKLQFEDFAKKLAEGN